MPTRDNASKNVIFFDDHSGHHLRCKNLLSFSLFSSHYFPWLYCVDFSVASVISIVLRHSSSSATQGQIVGARKSLNGRNRSLLFFAPYFSARLDFPRPHYLPPGSPRWSLVRPVQERSVHIRTYARAYSWNLGKIYFLFPENIFIIKSDDWYIFRIYWCLCLSIFFILYYSINGQREILWHGGDKREIELSCSSADCTATRTLILMASYYEALPVRAGPSCSSDGLRYPPDKSLSSGSVLWKPITLSIG